MFYYVKFDYVMVAILDFRSMQEINKLSIIPVKL
jgi:hypothetical protein